MISSQRIRKIALVSLLLLISSQGQALDFNGGFTVLGQSASDARIDNDITASVDLGMSWNRPNGRWYLYLEANNTPKNTGVATLLIESNADAGTALDKDRDGRLQISELNYQFKFSNDSLLTVGMLDASAYIDQSRITNDENIQFLGVSFVNNPSIEFPDYALGVVQEIKPQKNSMISLVVSSSNGLSDNTNVSYSQLVNIDEADKGFFLAAQYLIESGRTNLATGFWTHTAPHESLDGLSTNAKNYGYYAVAGWKQKKHALNARMSVANQEVMSAHIFGSLAYRYKSGDWVFAVGSSKIMLSDKAVQVDQDDTIQSEMYLRYELQSGLYLTGSLQHLINSGFDASNSDYDDRVYVSTVRLTYEL